MDTLPDNSLSRLTARVAIMVALCILFDGCSATSHPTVFSPAQASSVYIYWGSESENSANRFLSAQIHLDQDFSVGGDDFLDLKGHVEKRGTNLTADVVGNTGQESQFYRGSITLEKPFIAQGGAASGGADGPFWFLITTNSDCRSVLERFNAVRGLTGVPFDRSHRHLALPPPPMAPSLLEQNK